MRSSHSLTFLVRRKLELAWIQAKLSEKVSILIIPAWAPYLQETNSILSQEFGMELKLFKDIIFKNSSLSHIPTYIIDKVSNSEAKEKESGWYLNFCWVWTAFLFFLKPDFECFVRYITQDIFNESPFLTHLCKLSLGNYWSKYTWISTYKASAPPSQLSFSFLLGNILPCPVWVADFFPWGGGCDLEVADCHQVDQTPNRGTYPGHGG